MEYTRKKLKNLTVKEIVKIIKFLKKEIKRKYPHQPGAYMGIHNEPQGVLKEEIDFLKAAKKLLKEELTERIKLLVTEV